MPDCAQVHPVDLLNEAGVRALFADLRPTHLLHFAWNATPGVYWTTPDNFAWVSASLNMARAFWCSGGQRAVFAGSCAEYDWNRAALCIEDKTPTVLSTNALLASPYGTCKAALEKMLTSFAAQERASIAWGRIFFLYGPFEHPERLVPSVILNLLQGRDALCTHGKQRRSFMHVADVGAAFVDILESDSTGVINVGGAEEVTLGEVVSKIAALIGRPDLLQLGARAAPPNDPPVLLPDVHRLFDEVGFRPCYSLDEGLLKTVDWWRNKLEQK